VCARRARPHPREPAPPGARGARRSRHAVRVASHRAAASARRSRYEIAREPAPTDLRDVEPGTVAICYVTALHGVEREGDELLADVECRQGSGTARVSVYAPLARTEQIARLAPARIAEIRLDDEYGDEGELVSVLDAPWFDPRLEGGSTEALLPDR
jgi:hypothetical protein